MRAYADLENEPYIGGESKPKVVRPGLLSKMMELYKSAGVEKYERKLVYKMNKQTYDKCQQELDDQTFMSYQKLTTFKGIPITIDDTMQLNEITLTK